MNDPSAPHPDDPFAEAAPPQPGTFDADDPYALSEPAEAFRAEPAPGSAPAPESKPAPGSAPTSGNTSAAAPIDRPAPAPRPPAGPPPLPVPEPIAPSPRAYQPPPPGGLQHAGFTCPFCGYDLTGALIGGSCPECGSHINPRMLTTVQSNGMAITSMVMGILALVLGLATFGLATVLFAPLGIIFGHVAGRQLRTGRYNPGARGFAKAGLITSYIAAGIVAITWGLFFLLVV